MWVQLKSPPTGFTFADASGRGLIRDDGIAALKAELRISKISLDDTSLSVSQNMVVRLEVENTGKVNAPNVETSVYWSSDATFNAASDKLLGTEGHSTLDIGEKDTNERLTVAYQDIAKLGNGFIFAVIDPGKKIAEDNENDNLSSAVEVKFLSVGKPDLRISKASLDDATIKKNQDIRIDLEVRNDGTVDAADTRTTFYWSSNNTFGASDKKIGDDTHSTLYAKEIDSNEGKTIDYTDVAKYGSGYIFAVIDASNFISEEFEDNNISPPMQIWFL
jgi:subtilase family serine protease